MRATPLGVFLRDRQMGAPAGLDESRGLLPRTYRPRLVGPLRGQLECACRRVRSLCNWLRGGKAAQAQSLWLMIMSVLRRVNTLIELLKAREAVPRQRAPPQENKARSAATRQSCKSLGQASA